MKAALLESAVAHYRRTGHDRFEEVYAPGPARWCLHCHAPVAPADGPRPTGGRRTRQQMAVASAERVKAAASRRAAP